jgi:dUTPase
MSLYVYVIDPALRQKFRDHLANRRWTDSGFDLLCPSLSLDFPPGDETYGIELKLGVKCAALTEKFEPAPYLLLARSSTSLTPLRMSNQIGLADMGYRGELIARVDYIDTDDVEKYNIEQGRRLFQLVQHNWMPWKNIYIVDREEDLPPPPDSRGSGGFGSTGQ